MVVLLCEVFMQHDSHQVSERGTPWGDGVASEVQDPHRKEHSPSLERPPGTVIGDTRIYTCNFLERIPTGTIVGESITVLEKIDGDERGVVMELRVSNKLSGRQELAISIADPWEEPRVFSVVEGVQSIGRTVEQWIDTFLREGVAALPYGEGSARGRWVIGQRPILPEDFSPQQFFGVAEVLPHELTEAQAFQFFGLPSEGLRVKELELPNTGARIRLMMGDRWATVVVAPTDLDFGDAFVAHCEVRADEPIIIRHVLDRIGNELLSGERHDFLNLREELKEFPHVFYRVGSLQQPLLEQIEDQIDEDDGEISGLEILVPSGEAVRAQLIRYLERAAQGMEMLLLGRQENRCDRMSIFLNEFGDGEVEISAASGEQVVCPLASTESEGVADWSRYSERSQFFGELVQQFAVDPEVVARDIRDSRASAESVGVRTAASRLWHQKIVPAIRLFQQWLSTFP